MTKYDVHPDDVAIIERIELAFLEHGYTPIRGDFSDGKQGRCGLGALGIRTFAFADGYLLRSLNWMREFSMGFDAVVPSVSKQTGYAAEAECASRMFSKAPVESTEPTHTCP